MKRNLWNTWVVLHWLMALFVIATFAIGLSSLNSISDPSQKRIPLQVHIILGVVILCVTIFRYVLRVLVYKKPLLWKKEFMHTRKQQFILEQFDKYVHPLLYVLTTIMAILGVAIAMPAQLAGILFSQPPGQIPQNFYIYPARVWHGMFSTLLLILIFQHILVAVFHVFIKKDGYLKRMWFTGGRE